MRAWRHNFIGLALVVILIAITVFSATHGLLIGVLLAGFAAILFLAAVVDNRYYVRRTHRDGGGDEPQP